MTNSYLTPVDRQTLDTRYQSVAWALFLMMTGMLWLVPGIDLNGTFWFLGTGLILLGLNVVRAMTDIETNGFTMLCGLLAMSFGLSTLLGVRLPLWPGLLILMGVVLIVRARGQQ